MSSEPATAWLSSTYLGILRAVETLALATRLPDAGGNVLELKPSQVRIRRRPAFVKETDELPLLCICPETERLDSSHMGNADYLHYPVLLAVLFPSDLTLEGVARLLCWRENLRQKLRSTTLAGASAVYDVVGYDPGPAYDLRGLDLSFDVSLQRMVYATLETRNE